ncbi:MAG: glycosyl hydrolase [Acidobacteria bacterium]|nr:glycosyl hydrolase [Acidobacteriota bacterium]
MRSTRIPQRAPAFFFLAALLAAATLLQDAPRAQSGAIDPKLYQSLRWRNIGPDRGGRSIAVAGVRGRRLEAYFGAVGGGLWKTTDGGENWSAVTDGQIDSSSVGAVAVSESNPDVVYIGMGESHIRGNIMQGDGIYKSTDAGKTWTSVGFKTPGFTISRIRIHPSNPDIVYVAVFGNVVAPNPERGIYRTRDGGRTWQRVLFRDDRSAGIEVQIDANNPNVIYASLWEAYRRSWQMWSGGPGSGLFKSTDAGDTWTELTRAPGLPATGPVGKIGIAVSRADSNRVWVLLEHENGGLFMSDDAGASWKLVNDDRNIRQRAFYYSRVYADPRERDTVWMLNVNVYRSTDAGKTLQNVRAPHGDYHDLWIDPDDSAHLVNGNDGGGTVSWNTGQTWSDLEFPTAQIYRLSVTHTFPYYACGGQQDNSTVCAPVSARPGELGTGYFSAGGGESGYVTPHPTSPNLFYSGSQGALITRFDRSTGHIRDIQPYPRFFSGEPARDLPERWQWTFPIVFDPFDPNTLYISSQHVWKTTTDGQSWTKISPDLTRADASTLGDSGGPITRDMNGPEVFATVFAIGPSTVEKGLIWTGSDDGYVFVTRDGGGNWANVTPPGIGDFTRISTVEPSPHKSKAGTAYVAGKRYLVPPGDRAPYLFRTDDYGKTWTKIVTGIAPHHYAHSIREDPKRPGLLFAGTEHGVYVSFNDGESWQSLRLNMPDTQISDLAVKDDDLVVATHGRSFWVLENISTLRQLTPEITTTAMKVFEPRPAIRSYNRADVDYYLGSAVDRITVDILDAQGRVVRSFTRTAEEEKADEKTPAPAGGGGFGGPPQLPPSTKAGMNRFSWNLRYPGSTVFPGMIIWSGNPANGPMAVPGQYQVRVTAGSQAQTVPLQVQKHPLFENVSVADLQQQFDLAIQIRDRTSDANEAVIQIRDVKAQIQERLEQSKNPRLKEIGDLVTRKLSVVEEEIYQVRNRSGQDPLNFPIKINNRLASLRRSVETGDAAPTDASREVFKTLSAELQKQIDELAAITKGDLANFNKAATEQKLAPVAAKPVERAK